MIWIAPAVCPRYPVRPGYSPVTARLPPGRGNTPCCYTPIFIIEGSLKRERERERDGEKINFSSRPQNVHQLFPIDILPVHNQTFLLLLLLCYPHFFSLSISLSLLPPPPFLLLIWLWFIQLLFLFSFFFFSVSGRNCFVSRLKFRLPCRQCPVMGVWLSRCGVAASVVIVSISCIRVGSQLSEFLLFLFLFFGELPPENPDRIDCADSNQLRAKKKKTRGKKIRVMNVFNVLAVVNPPEITTKNNLKKKKKKQNGKMPSTTQKLWNSHNGYFKSCHKWQYFWKWY